MQKAEAEDCATLHSLRGSRRPEATAVARVVLTVEAASEAGRRPFFWLVLLLGHSHTTTTSAAAHRRATMPHGFSTLLSVLLATHDLLDCVLLCLHTVHSGRHVFYFIAINSNLCMHFNINQFIKKCATYINSGFLCIM